MRYCNKGKMTQLGHAVAYTLAATQEALSSPSTSASVSAELKNVEAEKEYLKNVSRPMIHTREEKEALKAITEGRQYQTPAEIREQIRQSRRWRPRLTATQAASHGVVGGQIEGALLQEHQEKLQRAQQEKEAAEAAQKEAESQILKQRIAITMLEEEAAVAHAEAEEANKKAAEANAKLNATETTLKNARDKILGKNAAIHALEKSNAELKEKLARFEGEQALKGHSLVTQLQEDIAKNQKSIAALEEQKAQLQETLNAAEIGREAAEERANVAKMEADAARKLIAKKSAEAAQKEKELRAEIDRVSIQTNEAVQAAKTEAAQRESELSQQLAHESSNLTKWRNQTAALDEKQKAIVAKANERAKERAYMETKAAKLQKLQRHYVTMQSSDVEFEQNENAIAFRKQIAQLQGEQLAHQKKHADLDAQVKTMEAEHAAARGQTSAQLSQAQKRIAELQKQKADVEEALKNKVATVQNQTAAKVTELKANADVAGQKSSMFDRLWKYISTPPTQRKGTLTEAVFNKPPTSQVMPVQGQTPPKPVPIIGGGPVPVAAVPVTPVAGVPVGVSSGLTTVAGAGLTTTAQPSSVVMVPPPLPPPPPAPINITIKMPSPRGSPKTPRKSTSEDNTTTNE